MDKIRSVRLWLFVVSFCLVLFISIPVFVITSGGWSIFLPVFYGGLFTLFVLPYVLIKAVRISLKGQHFVVIDILLVKKISLAFLGALLLNNADCGDFNCPDQIGTLFVQRLFHLPQLAPYIQDWVAFAGFLLLVAFGGLLLRLTRKAFLDPNPPVVT